MLLKSRHSLALHTLFIHDRESRVCRGCRSIIDNAEEMRAHLQTEHGIRKGEPLSFACDDEGCNKTFKTQKGLNQHISIMHR